MNNPKPGKTTQVNKYVAKTSSVEVVIFSPVIIEDEGITNPGHIALRIGPTLYNFGRYWGHYPYRPWTGPAVLRQDNADEYINKEKPKRSWIYGFVLPVKDLKKIKDKVNAIWGKGTSSPGKEGRQVGEYNLLTNSCKTFTFDLLQKGGVKVPSSFLDSPKEVRDKMIKYYNDKGSAEVKILEIKPYKADPDLQNSK